MNIEAALITITVRFAALEYSMKVREGIELPPFEDVLMRRLVELGGPLDKEQQAAAREIASIFKEENESLR